MKITAHFLTQTQIHKLINIISIDPAMYKKVTHHNQVGFILEFQSWLYIRRPVNVICHISHLKEKNHVNISIDPFMIKLSAS